MDERRRLALFGLCGDSSAMEIPGKNKLKRPWGGFGYLILVVLAVLVAWFLVLPVGRQVASVFQRLTDAFEHGK